jgi:hypothetical protein
MKKFMKWALTAVLMMLPLGASALEDSRPFTLHSGATANGNGTTIDVSRYTGRGNHEYGHGHDQRTALAGRDVPGVVLYERDERREYLGGHV